MRPETLKLLWDAREAASRVRRFTDGKSLDNYLGDVMLRSAVERQLEIVGEALNQLSRLDGETAARIEGLARIVAFRNVLIHGYAIVDDRLVWDIVESKLPSLWAVVQDLLGED